MLATHAMGRYRAVGQARLTAQLAVRSRTPFGNSNDMDSTRRKVAVSLAVNLADNLLTFWEEHELASAVRERSRVRLQHERRCFIPVNEWSRHPSPCLLVRCLYIVIDTHRVIQHLANPGGCYPSGLFSIWQTREVATQVGCSASSESPRLLPKWIIQRLANPGGC